MGLLEVVEKFPVLYLLHLYVGLRVAFVVLVGVRYEAVAVVVFDVNQVVVEGVLAHADFGREHAAFAC